MIELSKGTTLRSSKRERSERLGLHTLQLTMLAALCIVASRSSNFSFVSRDKTMTQLLTEAHPPIPLEELLERLHGFQTALLEAKKELIADLVAAHPLLNVAWGEGWRYRRARIVANDAPLEHVREFLWPPKPSEGRLSVGQRHIFYVADRVETALRESDVQAAHVALSEFVIRPGLSTHVCPIGELAAFIRTGRGNLIPALDALKDAINACPRDQARSLLITDAFLYEQLAGQDDYALSSCVAELVFSKLPQVTVLAYRSKKQHGAMNFGVSVDSFWNTWGLFSARRCNATHLAQGVYRLDALRHVTGIHTDGRLEWSGEPEAVESVIQLDPPYFPIA